MFCFSHKLKGCVTRVKEMALDGEPIHTKKSPWIKNGKKTSRWVTDQPLGGRISRNTTNRLKIPFPGQVNQDVQALVL